MYLAHCKCLMNVTYYYYYYWPQFIIIICVNISKFKEENLYSTNSGFSKIDKIGLFITTIEGENLIKI